MTAQQSLERVWAVSGASTDPGTVKYADGWVAEIPTFQNFNYVLQSSTKNLLALAESDVWAWNSLIAYEAGARVKRSGVVKYCVVAHTNQDPDTDTLGNYWSKADTVGEAPVLADSKKGRHIKNVDTSAISSWGGNSETITAPRPHIALNTTGATDNLLLGNISGNLAVVNVTTTEIPDGRNLSIGQPGVYKIYHEGNPQPETRAESSAFASFTHLSGGLSGGVLQIYTNFVNAIFDVGAKFKWGNVNVGAEQVGNVVYVEFKTLGGGGVADPFDDEPQFILIQENGINNTTFAIYKVVARDRFGFSFRVIPSSPGVYSGAYWLALGV